MFNQTEHYVYPFQSPARYARKVGNISSNNRENRLRQEANYKLFTRA